ncbi:MAG: type IX secretion system protein PorQ [Saprospiraceae bacterium]|nr:type IX secretion system protein PorQ [Saprospiraceae bacterium]
MKKIILFGTLSVLLTMQAWAQIGGNNVYEFLNFPSSARLAALGDHLISVKDADVSLAFANPALLNPQMHQQLSINHSFLLDGIQHGYAGYGHHLNRLDLSFHAGFQYVSYGDFMAADEFGNILGTFRAGENAFVLGAGKQLDERISVGANVKLITSQLESYHSFGISSDLGIFYEDTLRNLGLSLLFRNMGTQLSTYAETKESLPYEVQLGLSKRLKYLPFQFSIHYRYLNRWNILYNDPNNRENTFLSGFDNTPQSNGQLTNFFRHFVFNGEFFLGKSENLQLRMGYNVLRGQELKVTNLRSLAGFSFGVGLKVKRFRIDYGQGVFHLAGSMNYFSFSSNLFQNLGKK